VYCANAPMTRLGQEASPFRREDYSRLVCSKVNAEWWSQESCSRPLRKTSVVSLLSEGMPSSNAISRARM
jgi:hypothetical protein